MLIIAAIACFVAAHHFRLARDNGMALAAAGLGLYLIVPSWPGAAYDAVEKAWRSAPQDAANLVAAIALLAVCIIGLKLIFVDSWKR